MAGVQDILQLLINIKEANNDIRNQAETYLKEIRSSQP